MEGWTTGLRLIMPALQGQGQRSAQQMEQRLSTISGSQRHILEYLVAEVLSAQPEPLQTFLLQTTGLSRLTSSLCDTVTGRNDSAFLLEQIERANLFLLPLEGCDGYLDHPFLNKRYRTRKQPSVLKTNPLLLSVRHAGLLVDNRTPVGSSR